MNSLTREALIALAAIQSGTSLHLDPVGLDCEPPVLTVMDADDCALCALDVDNWPAEITGADAIAAYDALCNWAEHWGLATQRQHHLPGCDSWV